MLLAERNELLLVQTVGELNDIVGEERFEEFEDSVWCLELVLQYAEQVLRYHDRVPLRLAEDLSLLVELISHRRSVTFLQ